MTKKIFLYIVLLINPVTLNGFSINSFCSSVKNIFNVFWLKNSLFIKRYKKSYCTSFGEHSYAGSINVKSWGEGTSYSVGKYCSIADNITIFLGGNHRTDWISTYPFPSFSHIFYEAGIIQGHPATKGNVVIGNDVWIGSHVTILSGVTIGDGAVVGAYSVVARNVPPYSIVVGNPARVIRYRFDERTIELLLKIKWWDWPLEKIRQNVELLCSNNIEKFLDKNK